MGTIVTYNNEHWYDSLQQKMTVNKYEPSEIAIFRKKR